MAELNFLVILFEILPRLPAKVVTKCKVVCKEWYSFLSTDLFTKLHCQYMRASPDQKILFLGCTCCSIHSSTSESPWYSTLDYFKIPFTTHPYRMMVLASLDGMLCVVRKDTNELIVWNPLTEVYKNLSTSKSQGFYKIDSDTVGFCVDSSNDYNILHIKRRRGSMTIYIYSMRSGSWRTIRFLKKRPYHGATYDWSGGTFCDTGLYFTVTQLFIRGEKVIIHFDVDSKGLSEIRFPIVANEGSYADLISVRNQLHAFVQFPFGDRSVAMWKLEGKTWMKVFSLSNVMRLPLAPSALVTHVSEDDSCLLITLLGEMYQIDVHANSLDGFCRLTYFQDIPCVVYTETIVSPK